MKEYRRIKTVKAEPMSEFDAIGKNYSFRLAGDDSEWKEGYHVKECTRYGATHDYWVSKDVFEKAYKPSDTVLDRLKIERDELKERIEKIEALLGNGIYEVVKKEGGIPQAVLLILQLTYTISYLKVLETRIDLMEDNK